MLGNEKVSWGKGKSSATLLNLMSYHIIKNKRYKIHQGSDPANPWWSVYFHLLVQTFLQNRVVMMSCPWYAFVSPFLSDDFNLGTTEVGGCIFVGHFVGKICTHFATFGFLTPVKRGWLDHFIYGGIILLVYYSSLIYESDQSGVEMQKRISCHCWCAFPSCFRTQRMEGACN